MRKRLKLVLLKAFAASAMTVTAMVANSACAWIVYQEKMPENAKGLRKF